jgi:hypothetical protein
VRPGRQGIQERLRCWPAEALALVSAASQPVAACGAALDGRHASGHGVEAGPEPQPLEDAADSAAVAASLEGTRPGGPMGEPTAKQYEAMLQDLASRLEAAESREATLLADLDATREQLEAQSSRVRELDIRLASRVSPCEGRHARRPCVHKKTWRWVVGDKQEPGVGCLACPQGCVAAPATGRRYVSGTAAGGARPPLATSTRKPACALCSGLWWLLKLALVHSTLSTVCDEPLGVPCTSNPCFFAGVGPAIGLHAVGARGRDGAGGRARGGPGRCGGGAQRGGVLADRLGGAVSPKLEWGTVSVRQRSQSHGHFLTPAGAARSSPRVACR